MTAAPRSDPFVDGARMSDDEYFALPHAAYALGANARAGTAELRIAENLGGKQRNTVLIPQATLLPHFVGASSCIGLIQRRMFNRFRDVAGIREVKLEFEIPKLDIHAYWGASNQKDRTHQWFRALLREVAAGLH